MTADVYVWDRPSCNYQIITVDAPTLVALRLVGLVWRGEVSRKWWALAPPSEMRAFLAQ